MPGYAKPQRRENTEGSEVLMDEKNYVHLLGHGLLVSMKRLGS